MRILVVEDEKRIADFVSRGLESAGYAIDVAYDGSHAIDISDDHPSALSREGVGSCTPDAGCAARYYDDLTHHKIRHSNSLPAEGASSGRD